MGFTLAAALRGVGPKGLWGLAVNVPVLVAVSLATRPGDPERLRAYVEA
jgi:hypothetical protein